MRRLIKQMKKSFDYQMKKNSQNKIFKNFKKVFNQAQKKEFIYLF